MQKKIEYIITCFFKILGRIPEAYSVKIGNILGSLWFWADKRHRDIARNNLSRAFGNEKSPDEIRTLAEKVFQNLMQVIFEIGRYLLMRPENLDRFFFMNGIEHLTNALARGKGVLALTAHIGNWELLSAISAMKNLPTNVLYRPFDFLPMDSFFVNLRTRFGAKLIPKANSMRKVLKCLHQGEIVTFLTDQNVDWYEGVFTEYFGKPACTNKGMALIALKTEAPVIPVFLLRVPSGFLLEVMPEIPLIKTGDKIKDVEENTLRYNQAIEKIVRRFPEQWFWVHQRWKTKPYSACPRQVQK